MRSDETLLFAWREGDRDAGDELLSRHFDSLYRFFRTKLGDSVEDLVQRTFLDCVESRGSVRDGNFRAFMFGVARNRLYDHLRGQLRRGEAVDICELSLADLATSPSQAVARGEQEKLLVRALQRLPLDLQVALELAYWEGMSGREIALVLEVPDNTVRSRLVRARAKLREVLLELAGETALAETTLKSLDVRLPAGVAS